MYLTAALVGFFSFTHRPLYPRERALGTHWLGGWMGPKAGLDDVEKRKFLTLPRLELRPLVRPVRNQSLYRLRYPGFQYQAMNSNNETSHPILFSITLVFYFLRLKYSLEFSKPQSMRSNLCFSLSRRSNVRPIQNKFISLLAMTAVLFIFGQIRFVYAVNEQWHQWEVQTHKERIWKMCLFQAVSLLIQWCSEWKTTVSRHVIYQNNEYLKLLFIWSPSLNRHRTYDR
jgi:hypothetical protein